jgi:hypothetical protein
MPHRTPSTYHVHIRARLSAHMTRERPSYGHPTAARRPHCALPAPPDCRHTPCHATPCSSLATRVNDGGIRAAADQSRHGSRYPTAAPRRTRQAPGEGRGVTDHELPQPLQRVGSADAARRGGSGVAGSTSLHRGRGPAPGVGDETGRRPPVASASPAGLPPLDARVRVLIERERHYRDSAGALVPRRPEAVAYRLVAWYRVPVSVAEVAAVLAEPGPARLVTTAGAGPAQVTGRDQSPVSAGSDQAHDTPRSSPRPNPQARIPISLITERRQMATPR